MSSSKADKLRGKLGNYAKEREQFEMKKRELEEEMNKGKQNMGKIRKGLRNNEIKMEQPLTLEIVTASDSIGTEGMESAMKKPPSRLKKLPSNKSLNSETGINLTMKSTIIIPSGPLLSEWAYTAPLDSIPPIMKSQEMYETVRLLGRGSFGTVDLVKNVDDNRLYATKTIFCESESAEEMALEEVKFMRLNRHPCIVDLTDVFFISQPRVLNIVMQFCEAGDLGKVIAHAQKSNNPLSESQLLKWLPQLCLGLCFLHENQTLHRDLKPGNLLLTDNGDIVKIADFGLAVELQDGKHRSTTEAGTPYYTCPEMINNEPYSFPSDNWSLGVVLHELCRLALPFTGSTTADLVRSIVSDDPPPLPSHYSEDLKKISIAFLRKDPTDRLTASTALQTSLLAPKASGLIHSYRPKTVEERQRRAHVRQLSAQLERLSHTPWPANIAPPSPNLSANSNLDLILENEAKMKLNSRSGSKDDMDTFTTSSNNTTTTTTPSNANANNNNTNTMKSGKIRHTAITPPTPTSHRKEMFKPLTTIPSLTDAGFGEFFCNADGTPIVPPPNNENIIMIKSRQNSGSDLSTTSGTTTSTIPSEATNTHETVLLIKPSTRKASFTVNVLEMINEAKTSHDEHDSNNNSSSNNNMNRSTSSANNFLPALPKVSTPSSTSNGQRGLGGHVSPLRTHNSCPNSSSIISGSSNNNNASATSPDNSSLATQSPPHRVPYPPNTDPNTLLPSTTNASTNDNDSFNTSLGSLNSLRSSTVLARVHKDNIIEDKAPKGPPVRAGHRAHTLAGNIDSNGNSMEDGFTSDDNKTKSPDSYNSNNDKIFERVLSHHAVESRNHTMSSQGGSSRGIIGHNNSVHGKIELTGGSTGNMYSTSSSSTTTTTNNSDVLPALELPHPHTSEGKIRGGSASNHFDPNSFHKTDNNSRKLEPLQPLVTSAASLHYRPSHNSNNNSSSNAEGKETRK